MTTSIIHPGKAVAKILPVLAVLAAITLIQACSETRLAPPPVNAADEFPNNVGAEWTYEVHNLLDPLQTNFDIVRVRIDRDTTLPDSTHAQVWEYLRTQSSVVVSFHNELTFIAGNRVVVWRPEELDSTALLFPLKVSNIWITGGAVRGDSIAVVGEPSVTVPAGTFGKAYEIVATKRTTVPEDIRIIKSWFVPRLGFVMFERLIQRGLLVIEERWVLLAHNNDNFR